MGKTYDEIDETLVAFIEAQRMFFIATAPLASDGLVNLSPKGMDTLRILDSHTLAYLDLTGSGVETIAHLKENARFVLMFCSFEGPPRLLRLYGRGEVIEPGDAEWDDLVAYFGDFVSARSIVRVALERIADSCGYGVPEYRYEGEREQLLDWADRKGEAGLRTYRAENNARSLDGLPGLRRL